MSFRSLILSFLCVWILPLFAEEEIRIELNTKHKLSSIYVSRIQGQEANFQPDYLKDLRKVLEFDINYSGFAKLLQEDETLEKVLVHSEPSIAFNAHRWIKAGAEFVLKGEVKGKKLNLFAFNVSGETIQFFEGLELSGELSLDRKQIHKLSDAVMKTLFGVEGIASSTVLYSTQLQSRSVHEKDWKAEIWACDWDGNNPRQVTMEQSYSITPVFIPFDPVLGKDRYLYVNYKNGQPKIYYSSLKHRTGNQLLDLRGNQLLPAISSKRDKLAFISDASGRADLFLQHLNENGTLDGKPKQLFSYPRSTQGSPTFSPDGTLIAFVSDKDGTPRIYTIASTLENNKRPTPKLLTKRNRENTCPSWSPDGTKLAYSAKTNGVRQIWIYDFLAEEEQQLTTGPGNKENPCWARDSLHLIFNSTDPDSSELYLVNLHQPNAVKITDGPGKKHYPTWGMQ